MAWYFVYTREAHPGEHVGHHTSFDVKLANAELLRDEVGIRREILVDDLTGTAHRAFGAMPNMTWVIGRGGRVAYRADWTSAVNVEAFVDRYRHARSRKPARGSIASYTSEQVEFRDVDRAASYARLRRNGPRAYDEFKHAERIWQARK